MSSTPSDRADSLLHTYKLCANKTMTRDRGKSLAISSTKSEFWVMQCNAVPCRSLPLLQGHGSTRPLPKKRWRGEEELYHVHSYTDYPPSNSVGMEPGRGFRWININGVCTVTLQRQLYRTAVRYFFPVSTLTTLATFSPILS